MWLVYTTQGTVRKLFGKVLGRHRRYNNIKINHREGIVKKKELDQTVSND
jgi:hypothetical protein